MTTKTSSTRSPSVVIRAEDNSNSKSISSSEIFANNPGRSAAKIFTVVVRPSSSVSIATSVGQGSSRSWRGTRRVAPSVLGEGATRVAFTFSTISLRSFLSCSTGAPSAVRMVKVLNIRPFTALLMCASTTDKSHWVRQTTVAANVLGLSSAQI